MIPAPTRKTRMFVGLLLAVPAAAVIGVLVRFTLSRYLSSRLYLGADGVAAVGQSEIVPTRETTAAPEDGFDDET